MTNQEKIALLEEIMELDENTLSPDDILEDYMEWDSLTRLSLMSEIDDRFHKSVSSETIKSVKTVADVLKLMNVDE